MRRVVLILVPVVLIFYLFFCFREQHVRINNVKQYGTYIIFKHDGITEIYKIKNNRSIVIYNYTYFDLVAPIKKVNLDKCFRLNGNFSTISGDMFITNVNLSNDCVSILRKLTKSNLTPRDCLELYKKGEYIEISCKNITIRMYLSNT